MGRAAGKGMTLLHSELGSSRCRMLMKEEELQRQGERGMGTTVCCTV
jgi:hypothetical protein